MYRTAGVSKSLWLLREVQINRPFIGSNGKKHVSRGSQHGGMEDRLRHSRNTIARRPPIVTADTGMLRVHYLNTYIWDDVGEETGASLADCQIGAQ